MKRRGWVLALLFCGLVGCSHTQSRAQSADDPDPMADPDIKNVKTIADVGAFSRAEPLQVSGVGLVQLADETGGGNPAGQYRQMLEEQLLKQGVKDVKQILASSQRAKRVIDLTGDDDDDREGGDGDFTEVSWLRSTRTARHLVRLIPPSLIDRIRVAGQLRSPYTALSDKVTNTHCRRPRNVVYGGHTWQEEKSLDQCPAVVPIAP